MFQKTKYREILQIVIAVVILAFMLIPLFLLAQYTSPLADDFAYANHIHAIMEKESLPLFPAAIEATRNLYNSWQGTYFSAFVAYTSPFITYGESVLAFCMTMIILAFCISVLFCTRAFLSQYFQCKKWSVTLWLYVLIIFLMTQFLPVQETFFWLNGATTYTIPFSCCLTAFAFFIYAYYSSGVKKVILVSLSSLFFIFGCGGVLIIGVFVLMVLFPIALRSLYHKRSIKACLPVLIPFIICVIASLANALAPGNAERQYLAQGGNVASIKNVLWFSLKGSSTIYTSVLPVVMLICVLLLTSFLAMSFLKRQRQHYRHPLLILLYAMFTLFACIVPVVVGYGSDAFPPRVLTLVVFIAIGVAVFCTIYITGWLLNREFAAKNRPVIRLNTFVLGIVTLAIVISIHPISTWHSASIVENYANGNIQQQKIEISNAFSQIANSPDKDVVIIAPKMRYALLNNFHVNSDPDSWGNQAVAIYYGKDSVRAE